MPEPTEIHRPPDLPQRARATPPTPPVRTNPACGRGAGRGCGPPGRGGEGGAAGAHGSRLRARNPRTSLHNRGREARHSQAHMSVATAPCGSEGKSCPCKTI
ncbi:hypothetical protein GCM10020254_33200 [Streptomyces goshikiensis]